MSEQSEKPITGKHVFIALCAFFGVIIAVNFTMAALANRSWTGLEVKNSYVASQDYNRKLAEVERQAALGWSSSLETRDGEAVFTLKDTKDAGISSATIEARLKRPVQESEDVMLNFTPVGGGSYRATLPARPGVWDVDITAHGPDQEIYRQVFRIHVKG